MKTPTLKIATVLLVSLGLGCESTTGPGEGEGTVSLSFASVNGSGPTAVAAFSGRPPVTQTDGTNELVIERVQLVLREIELERANDDDCDDLTGDAHDDCEEFDAGPLLLDLPLGDIEQTLSVNVPADVYDEIEFDLHKPGDDARDRAFVEANPEFEEISMRVDGTWNGTAFTYTSDLNEEQEIELSPPLVVEEGTTSTNLTIRVDLSNWFRDAQGNLVDPATGAKGGVNENLIEDNIENSFEAFEDDDEDGEDDDDS